MVYVIPIASGSENADNSGIIQICQRFKVDVCIKVWTRQEFREVFQIEQNKTTFFDGTHVLCIFIDKLPDGIGNRVRFLTRILL